ncbi:MAG: DUF4349 domain-containing protein [Cyanobacteria bacterium P01_H01_bin.58]
MRLYHRSLPKYVPQILGAFSMVALMGCGSAYLEGDSASYESAPADSLSLTETEAINQEPANREADSTTATRNQRRPQLIKNANLRIELADVDTAIANISTLLQQNQGDLIELSDQATEANVPRQVWVELRVPQSNLENVLEELRTLGTVQEQSITAEDVSNQLVDLQARVRNLRKSEEALLDIMDRSGAVADVLEVARELSTVREAIERTDAQFQNLQNQVAYSTISLTLVSKTVAVPTAEPIRETLGETWQTANTAVRGLSVALLQLLLWLLVFSPYVGMLAIAGWAGRWYWQRQHPS